MRKSSKLLILAGIIVLVAVGSLYFWRGDKPPQTPAQAPVTEPPPATADTNHSSFFSKHPSSSTNEDAPSVPAPATNLTNDWADRIDTILASDVPESDKVKQFLEMFPKLPPDGQEAVANHLSNLLPNEQYAHLAAFFTNAALSPDVLDILLRDALNRPNSLKLPVLLEVARNPQHPKAAEAKETLAFLLEEDDGDDWAKWQAKMDEWLKANPD